MAQTVASVNTIIRECRAYLLKSRALPIAVFAVLAAGFGVLAANANVLFGEELNITWLFIVLGAIAALLLLREGYVNIFSKPGRLRIHLNNLPSEERARVIDEFVVTAPCHGRYFLRDFILFFPFDPGIIRYEKIDEVSSYPQSVGITGGGRLIFLKTEKSEDPADLAQRILDRVPDKPIPENDENGENDEGESETLEITTHAKEVSGEDE